MDEQTLTSVLADAHNRQFWIVLWGDPTHSPDEDAQVFKETFYDQGLTRDVPDMRIGDILFVHRIKVSKIIFVSEVVELPRKSTVAESEEEDWRKHWKWSVRLKNLTPNYGRWWRHVADKTFPLNQQFNDQHPKEPISIGRLQHGSHVKISQTFAKFLLNEIISLGQMDRVLQEWASARGADSFK